MITFWNENIRQQLQAYLHAHIASLFPSLFAHFLYYTRNNISQYTVHDWSIICQLITPYISCLSLRTIRNIFVLLHLIIFSVNLFNSGRASAYYMILRTQ